MEQDINQLICQNQQFLSSRAMKIATSREEALDLVQDTILRILEQEAKFDRNLNFRTWSAQVMRNLYICLLYTSPSPRDRTRSRMPSSA